MTTAASIIPVIGHQPIGNFWTTDTVQKHPLGTKMTYADPYLGGGEAIYLQMPTSTALQVGTLMSWDTATSFVAAATANTANLGKAVGFLMNYVPSNASAQYAWVVISGQFYAYATASVAANTAFGITAAGQIGAIANGKQILNARVTKPATTAPTFTVTTQSGSNVLRVSKTDGLFVGCPISGTGIPASTYIGGLGPMGNSIIMTTSDLSTAANATASGSITMTATYNDGTAYWNVVTCDRPFAQGQVT